MINFTTHCHGTINTTQICFQYSQVVTFDAFELNTTQCFTHDYNEER